MSEQKTFFMYYRSAWKTTFISLCDWNFYTTHTNYCSFLPTATILA